LFKVVGEAKGNQQEQHEDPHQSKQLGKILPRFFTQNVYVVVCG